MGMRQFYILSDDGQQVIACSDIRKWGKWYEYANRVVKQEEVGNMWISTIFLGIDYGWGNGAPIVWETMVFKNNLKGEEMDRCAGNREQALAMHQNMVERMQAVVALET